MLIARGLPPGEVPEAWNLQHPERIVAVQREWLEAGADVIQTNTFGANRIKLRGTSIDAAGVNEAAAALGRRAIDDSGDPGPLLAGEIGPTGEFLPPVGTLDADAAREAFREQARALAGGGVDLFLVETMYDLREAVTAVRAVREVSDLPVLATCTFDRKPRGFFTVMGDTPERAAATLVAEGAAFVGANCTLASGDMVDLTGEFRGHTDAPLLIQPNAGQPELVEGRPVYGQTAEEFAADALRILEAGADAVGGCCGTTPAFIRAIRVLIDSRGGDAG